MSRSKYGHSVKCSLVEYQTVKRAKNIRTIGCFLNEMPIFKSITIAMALSCHTQTREINYFSIEVSYISVVLVIWDLHTVKFESPEKTHFSSVHEKL